MTTSPAPDPAPDTELGHPPYLTPEGMLRLYAAMLAAAEADASRYRAAWKSARRRAAYNGAAAESIADDYLDVTDQLQALQNATPVRTWLRDLPGALAIWFLNPRCPWCYERTSNLEAHMHIEHAGEPRSAA